MGQLRQAQCPVGTKSTSPTLRAKMLLPLLAGFMVSSTTVFALAWSAGAAVRSTVPLPTNLLVVPLLALCALTDIAFPRLRPLRLNRQTPRSLAGLFPLPVVGLLWGLDTGTAVSTVRASAASWGALALTFAGWGPWWVGLAYGAAFSVPLGLIVATYPAGGGIPGERRWRRRSTESLVEALVRTVRHVRLAGGVTALLGVAAVILGTS
jgi:hypothetical protein